MSRYINEAQPNIKNILMDSGIALFVLIILMGSIYTVEEGACRHY